MGLIKISQKERTRCPCRTVFASYYFEGSNILMDILVQMSANKYNDYNHYNPVYIAHSAEQIVKTFLRGTK